MGGEEEEEVGHWGEELGIGAEGRRVLEEDGEKGLGSGGLEKEERRNTWWEKGEEEERRGEVLGGYKRIS